MILNAILGKVLNSDPLTILAGILAMAAFVGLASSLLVPLFFTLMDNRPKVKAQRKKDLNAALQDRYEKTCMALVEMGDKLEAVEKENVELRRLNAERLQFDRYHDSRTKAAMKGRAQ